MKKTISNVLLALAIVALVGCSNEPKSIMNGKTVNFIGDSITKPNIYPKEVKSILGLSDIENYGVGGSSLCKRTKDLDEKYPPLVSKWEEIEEADVFFILSGTNDYSNSVPLGDVDSQSLSEFNGCLNTVLGGLKEKYPNTKIVVSTILKRKDNGLPIQVPEYNEAIKSKVEEYGLLLFDGYNAEGLDIGSDKNREITDDNLHPNDNGAEILGERVAEYLENNASQ